MTTPQNKNFLPYNFYPVNQAKVKTLRLLSFRLGYCGNDEEVKALTSVAIGAAESFFVYFFCGKKSKSHCPARGQERLSICFNFFVKNINCKWVNITLKQGV